MCVVQTVGGLFSSAGYLRCASVSMHTFEWPAACANSPALGHTACTASSALPSGAPPLGRPVRFSDQRWSSCCSCGRAHAETPPSDDSQAVEVKGERLRPRRSSGGTLALTGGVLATFVISHFLAGCPPPTSCRTRSCRSCGCRCGPRSGWLSRSSRSSRCRSRRARRCCHCCLHVAAASAGCAGACAVRPSCACTCGRAQVRSARGHGRLSCDCARDVGLCKLCSCMRICSSHPLRTRCYLNMKSKLKLQKTAQGWARAGGPLG